MWTSALKPFIILFILFLIVTPSITMAYSFSRMEWSIEDAKTSIDNDLFNVVCPIETAYGYIVNLRYFSDTIYGKLGKVHGPDNVPFGHNVTWGDEIIIAQESWFGGTATTWTYLQISRWQSGFVLSFNDDGYKVVRIFFMGFDGGALTLNEGINKTLSYREPAQFRNCRAHVVTLQNDTNDFDTLLIANQRIDSYDYLEITRLDSTRTWARYLVYDMVFGGYFSSSLIHLSTITAYLSYGVFNRLVTLNNDNAEYGITLHDSTMLSVEPYVDGVWEHTPLRCDNYYLFLWAQTENEGVGIKHAVRLLYANMSSMTITTFPWVNLTSVGSPYHSPIMPLRESFVMGFNNPELPAGPYFNDIGVYYYYYVPTSCWMAANFSILGSSPYVGVYDGNVLSTLPNAPDGTGLGNNYGLNLQLNPTVNVCSYQDSSSKSTVRFVSAIEWEDEYYADFVGSPTLGNSPMVVLFTYLGSWMPDATYIYDFGDEQNSTSFNTYHTYNWPGVYDVKLTVNSSIGTFYENKTAYITVLEPDSTIYLTEKNGSMYWGFGFLIAFIMIVIMLKRGK